MNWVSGYTDDTGLVAFLKKAKAHLEMEAGPSRRKTKPGFFIFLFDNVLPEGRIRKAELGQRFRTELEYDIIFTDADLTIHDKSGRKPMPGNRLEVQLWVLY